MSIGSDAQIDSSGVRRVAPPRPKKADEDPATAPMKIIFVVLIGVVITVRLELDVFPSKVQIPTKPINTPNPTRNESSLICGAIKLHIAIKGIALASNIKVIKFSSVEDLRVFIARGSDTINMAAKLPRIII
jgi:hypothetical protein